MSALDRTASIVATELRLASRNSWILLATGVLGAFALALAFLGSGPSGALKADPLVLTAASLATLSVYLVPLIALLLTYDTVAGEIERGTLALTLATPVSRAELLGAKFIGQLLVVTFAIAIGYGVAAAAVVAVHGVSDAGLTAWGVLCGTAILLGAVFIAIGTAISAASRQTGTAAAISVAVWLVVVVLYDLGLLAGLILDGGGTFAKVVFPYLVLANPGDAFRLFNLAMLSGAAPVAGLDGLAATLPFSPFAALGALGLWLAAALGLAHLVFRRTTP